MNKSMKDKNVSLSSSFSKAFLAAKSLAPTGFSLKFALLVSINS